MGPVRVGLHTISVGPLAAEQTVDVDSYRVIITSHVSGVDTLPDGEPIVFTAVTDPPGNEADITWLSSTKYGTAYPVLGEGPIFVAEFNETWGSADGTLGQWLGVKANNAAFGQDQKAFELSVLGAERCVFDAAGNCIDNGSRIAPTARSPTPSPSRSPRVTTPPTRSAGTLSFRSTWLEAKGGW